MKNHKIIWEIILALLFMGLTAFAVCRSIALNKITATLSELSFTRPTEFEFKETSDGNLEFDLRPNIEDLVDFKGTIRLFRDYDEYISTYYTPGNIIDSKSGKYIPVTPGTKYSRLVSLSERRTNKGDVIVKIGYGDAGGLSMRYLVYLSNPINNHQVLVEIKKWTYEDPPIWGTMENERAEQQETLDNLFEEMAKSFQFK